MGRWTERRALYHEDDDSYDPYLSLDVNEYLIANFPVLSLKQRRSVWTMAQNDEDFDWSSIEEQVNYYVDRILNASKEADDDEEEYPDIYWALSDYIESNFDNIDTEDEYYPDTLLEIIETLDELIIEAFDDEDKSEEEEEEE